MNKNYSAAKYDNLMELMFWQFAFNLKKGGKILEVVPV
jgi:hypothetical protein